MLYQGAQVVPGNALIFACSIETHSYHSKRLTDPDHCSCNAFLTNSTPRSSSLLY